MVVTTDALQRPIQQGMTEMGKGETKEKNIIDGDTCDWGFGFTTLCYAVLYVSLPMEADPYYTTFRTKIGNEQSIADVLDKKAMKVKVDKFVRSKCFLSIRFRQRTCRSEFFGIEVTPS